MSDEYPGRGAKKSVHESRSDCSRFASGWRTRRLPLYTRKHEGFRRSGFAGLDGGLAATTITGEDRLCAPRSPARANDPSGTHDAHPRFIIIRQPPTHQIDLRLRAWLLVVRSFIPLPCPLGGPPDPSPAPPRPDDEDFPSHGRDSRVSRQTLAPAFDSYTLHYS